jgi:hypothetical protein
VLRSASVVLSVVMLYRSGAALLGVADSSKSKAAPPVSARAAALSKKWMSSAWMSLCKLPTKSHP